MTPRRSLLLVAILLLAWSTRLLAADRITYDSQCLTIDGRDTVVYSGAFHYFRCPKELWRDRFQKMKEAGLNTVETYVAWNWHERAEPADVNDFSRIDMTDLEDWLKMAEDEFGFFVILRPGPYICSEWDGGGYPQWLMKYRPAEVNTPYWLRSGEEKYLAWCRHWYQAIAKCAQPHQLTHRPPGKRGGVILWQIENEYDFSRMTGPDSIAQIRMLARASRDFGIDVPLITCMTKKYGYRDDPFLRENVVETLTCYPDFNADRLTRSIDALAKYQPDKFRTIIELQGGWFTSVSDRQRMPGGYTAPQLQHVALASLERGVSVINFYMFFGGTNFGEFAPRRITTTYDYQAPIHEPGGVGERWRAAAAIGNMIRQHEQQLARSKWVELEVVNKKNKDVSIAMRKAADGARFVFVRNLQNKEPRSGSATIRAKGEDTTIEVAYELEPFGSKVLHLGPDATQQSQGKWLPDLSSVAMPKRPAPEQLPATVKIVDSRRKIEPLPSSEQWQPMQNGRTLEDLGVLDCRYVYYRATLPPEARSAPAKWGLTVKLPPGDSLLAQLDGRTLAAETSSEDGETAIRLDGAEENGAAGTGQVVLLYENAGHPHSGTGGMERRKGIGELRLKPVYWLGHNIEGWKVLPVEAIENRPEVAADFDDSSWKTANIAGERGYDLRQGEVAVFRASFDAPPNAKELAPLKLVFGHIDDTSIVYLNGEKIGETHDWNVAHRFDITDKVKPGRNVVALVAANTDGEGGVSRGVKLEPKSSQGELLPLSQVALNGAARSERWWDPSLDDATWESIKLDSSATSAGPIDTQPLQTWYRMRFSLPKASANVWAPWKVHINATGNGYLYLNGHTLGRFWQRGPQRDFYLPECWLKFGEVEQNVLTLSLRPLDGPAMLQSAEVSVYADQAEVRE
jgi:hypothetical protein